MVVAVARRARKNPGEGVGALASLAGAAVVAGILYKACMCVVQKVDDAFKGVRVQPPIGGE